MCISVYTAHIIKWSDKYDIFLSRTILLFIIIHVHLHSNLTKNIVNLLSLLLFLTTDLSVQVLVESIKLSPFFCLFEILLCKLGEFREEKGTSKLWVQTNTFWRKEEKQERHITFQLNFYFIMDKQNSQTTSKNTRALIK